MLNLSGSSVKIKDSKTDFNTFIDEILELVAPALIEEKVSLPDLVQQFEQGVLFVTLSASATVCESIYQIKRY